MKFEAYRDIAPSPQVRRGHAKTDPEFRADRLCRSRVDPVNAAERAVRDRGSLGPKHACVSIDHPNAYVDADLALNRLVCAGAHRRRHHFLQ